MISSDVPHRILFSEEKLSDMHTNDEHRMLMDDLKITKDSVNITNYSDKEKQFPIYFSEFQNDASSNIFTGEEELFAFERTKSRLHEMQSPAYWEQWEKHR